MNRVAIRVPTFLYPKKDPVNPCPCEDRPVELTHKTCLVFWQKQVGDRVSAGDTIADIESEKKTMELAAPAAGVLAEICLDNGGRFTADQTLGFIEED